MITYENKDETRYAITAEARTIVEHGSPEARVWGALPADAGVGKGLDELRTTLGDGILKIGQGQGFKKKWIKKLPDGTIARDPSVIDKIDDSSRTELAEIARTGQAPGGDAKKVADLKKRQLLEIR